jgi:hypothetical protein
MRYSEEVELLLEEMRRVLAFLAWDRDRWKRRAEEVPQRVHNAGHPSTPSATLETATFEEGLRAYALQQAGVRLRLFETFSQQWNNVPAFIEIIDRALAENEGEVVGSAT